MPQSLKREEVFTAYGMRTIKTCLRAEKTLSKNLAETLRLILMAVSIGRSSLFIRKEEVTEFTLIELNDRGFDVTDMGKKGYLIKI